LRAGSDLWSRWKALAHRIGSAQARVLLSVLYFTVLLPFVLLLRLTTNPFRGSGWHRHEGADTTEAEAARRQF
jgi:hypothetical protein